MQLQCQSCQTIGSERRGQFKAVTVPAQGGNIVALQCVKCGSFALKKVQQ